MKMFEYFEDDHFIYIAAELCPGREFFDFITQNKYLTEKTSRSIFYEVVSAVRYMHENKFMHRYCLEHLVISNQKTSFTTIQLAR